MFIAPSHRYLASLALAAGVVLALLRPALGHSRERRISIPRHTFHGPNQHRHTGANVPNAVHIPGHPGSLANQRFHELAYGLSFREPAGTYKILQTTDGALVKYLFPNGSTFSFYIRHSGKSARLKGAINGASKDSEQHSRIGPQTQPLTLDQVKTRALNQFLFAYPSAERVKDKHPKIKIAQQPGVKLYFLVPNKKHGDWVAGQAFMLVGGRTVAMFQMQCLAHRFAKQRKLFESLLHSATLEDPQKLNGQRQRQLTAGVDWLQTITDQRINQALHGPRWFRITQNDKDVGYECVTAANARQMGDKGVRVLKQLHIDAGKSTYVSIESFFASRNGSIELWSIRSARYNNAKPKITLPGAGKPPEHAIWSEIGVRSNNDITVSRHTPSKHTTHHWKKPHNGYLSQVAAKLLMGMLPHQHAKRYAFYAYDANTGQLSLRLVSVKPLAGGKFQVTVRRTPDRAPRISTYDSRGRLIKRRLPDGRVLLRTQPDQLRKIWHIPAPNGNRRPIGR